MEEIFSRNFIEEAIDKDLEEKVYDHVQTRITENVTCVLTILTLQRKIQNTLTQ